MIETETTSGRRVVGWVFVGALALGIGFGYFIGVAISNGAALTIGLPFLTFRPTPLNMAAYGGGAVLVIAGVFAVLMRLANRIDDAEAT